MQIAIKSPFTQYREGYIDGFNGNPVRVPEDGDYLRGYAEGKEDDQHDEPAKFSEAVYPISVMRYDQ